MAQTAPQLVVGALAELSEAVVTLPMVIAADTLIVL